MACPGTKEREERDEELKNLYVDKEELEDKDSNENLAKMVLINDLERVLLLKEGKMQEAEVVAQKTMKSPKNEKGCWKSRTVMLKCASYSPSMKNVGGTIILNVRMGVNCTFVVRGWHPSTRVAIFLMTTNVDHVPPNWEMNAGWKNNLRRSCQS